jgi:hypothetical protein
MWRVLYSFRHKELAQMSEKQLEAKIRELENWNFRLNLDEGAVRLYPFVMDCSIPLLLTAFCLHRVRSSSEGDPNGRPDGYSRRRIAPAQRFGPKPRVKTNEPLKYTVPAFWYLFPHA